MNRIALIYERKPKKRFLKNFTLKVNQTKFKTVYRMAFISLHFPIFIPVETFGYEFQ